MSKAVRKGQPDESDAGTEAADAERFLRGFRRRMAEQGMIVRMANPQPNWEPAVTFDVPADELSAMVVHLRRGGRVRNYFLDASAVVRLYAVEPGSKVVKDIVRSAAATPPTAQAVVCDLSLPETVSALIQIAAGPRGPARGVSKAALHHLLPNVRRDFVGETPVLSLVPSTGCMELAAELVERYRLRVADAVQLAAAVRMQNVAADQGALVFVSEDTAQCRAAEGEGLEVLRTGRVVPLCE